MSIPKIRIRNTELHLELLDNKVHSIYKIDKPTNVPIEISKEFSNILNCYCLDTEDEVFIFKVSADIYYRRIAHGHGIVQGKTDEVFTSLMLFPRDIVQSEILEHVEKNFRLKKTHGGNYILKNINISHINVDTSCKIFKLASC